MIQVGFDGAEGSPRHCGGKKVSDSQYNQEGVSFGPIILQMRKQMPRKVAELRLEVLLCGSG